jgi:hypothetical protein
MEAEMTPPEQRKAAIEVLERRARILATVGEHVLARELLDQADRLRQEENV